jgi:hypothetical protein
MIINLKEATSIAQLRHTMVYRYGLPPRVLYLQQLFHTTIALNSGTLDFHQLSF